MGEENVRRMYETLAKIISEREQVNVTVTVTKVEPKEKVDSIDVA